MPDAMKPRGWLLYTTQTVCIANSRGVAKGIKDPPTSKSTQVTGYVITDPQYVDYDPPPEPFKLDPVTFRRNPFEEPKMPEFIDSSSVEDPAYVGNPKILR